jgi:hypothetical protein
MLSLKFKARLCHFYQKTVPQLVYLKLIGIVHVMDKMFVMMRPLIKNLKWVTQF